MLKRLLFLMAFAVPAVYAQAGPDPAGTGPGFDWLKTVADQISNLITEKGDALVSLGTIELSFIALYMLIAMVCRWQLSHMVVGNRPVNFTVGDFFVFVLQLSACMLMLNYYNTPLPGTSVKFHQIFSYVALQITNIFDQETLNSFLQHLNDAQNGMQTPGNPLDFLGVIIYSVVFALIAIVRGVGFTIDAAGFIFNGLFVLFGPLLIPLYMTRRFAGKFWQWLDGLITVSMWRAVAAAQSFIWWNVFIGFFDVSVNGNYTLGHWLEVLPVFALLSIACIWSTFKIPMITSWIFGGFSGQAATEFATGAIVTAVRAAL